jgi:hypothetical protein
LNLRQTSYSVQRIILLMGQNKGFFALRTDLEQLPSQPLILLFGACSGQPDPCL